MPAEDTPPPQFTLLGPQRRPRLAGVLRAQGRHGQRVALINAGWREREPDDGLLTEQAGGNAVNLRLWHRMQEVWEADPEFAAADRARRDALEESQALYRIGLDHVTAAIRAMTEREPRARWVHERGVADAEAVLREVDEIHLRRVQEIYGEFWVRWPPHERPAVAELRDTIARELAGVQVVVLAGGHVGVLIGALHLFTVAPAIPGPVIAWGAGAMALTDRVVLYHDRAAQGPGVPELFTPGVGLVHGLVALPSASERLDTADQWRMGLLSRRLAPSVCVALDPRVQVDVPADGTVPPETPVVDADGRIRPLGEP